MTAPSRTAFVLVCLAAVMASAVPLPPQYQALLEDLDGFYSGKKSIVGVEIEIDMTFKSGSVVDVTIASLGVECPEEAYTLEKDGSINIPGASSENDCLGRALKEQKAEIKSLSFDDSTNEVVAKLGYNILTVTFHLKHHSPGSLLATPSTPAKKADLNSAMMLLPSVMLQDPSGDYQGSTTIFGTEVSIKMAFTPSSFDIDFSGPLTLSCKNEAYTLKKNNISITNIDKQGDCLHDDLVQNGVTLDAVTYDAPTDSISIEAHLSFINFSITLEHQAVRDIAHTAVSRGTPSSFLRLIHDVYPLTLLQAPTGLYSTIQPMLGLFIEARITFKSDNKLSLSFSEGFQMSCENESYSFSSGVVTLTNANDEGNCVHDALAAHSVSLDSIVYDGPSNEVTVLCRHKQQSVRFVMQRGAPSFPLAMRKPRAMPTTPTTFAERVEMFLPLFLDHAPEGTYNGSKSVLGEDVHASMVFSASTMDFHLTGPVTINCKAEPYTYSNGVISLTNIGKSGDCVHDALSQYKASLKGINYDESSDQVSATVKVAIVSVELTLNHVK